MAILKCTMLITLPTKPTVLTIPARVAGWSESWYVDADLATARLLFQGGDGSLCAKRAALLSNDAVIVGSRYSTIDGTGRTNSDALSFPATSGLAQDEPGTSILIRVKGTGVSNTKNLLLRGFPDDLVKQGELVPIPRGYGMALEAFSAELTDSGFKFRGQDFSFPSKKVLTVTAGGLVTTQGAHGLIVGDPVKLSRIKLGGSNSGKSYLAEVVAPVTATTFTLGVWLPAVAANGGACRKYAIIYPTVARGVFSLIRASNRRVGRPFAPYVGRRPKK